MVDATAPRPRAWRRRERRDWPRLAARVLCAALALVGAVPFALVWLVRTSAVRDWAARATAAALEHSLGVSTRYRLRVESWPLGLTLSDVVVDASDGKGPALTAVRISVRPRLFSLVSGRVDAGQIEIDAPRVRLVVRAGEVENVHYRLPEAAAPPTGRPSKRAPFSSIAVTDAAFDLTWNEVHVGVHDLDVDVAAEAGPAFEISVRGGEQRIDRVRPSLAETRGADVAFDEDRVCQLDGRVRVSSGRVTVRRLWIAGSLDLDEAEGTRPPCDLTPEDPRRVELGLRQFHAALRADGQPELDGTAHVRAPAGLVNRLVPFLPLHGFAAADVDVRYPGAGGLPSLHGAVRGSGLELGKYKLAADLASDVTIEDGTISVDRAAVSFADGKVVVNRLAVEPLKKGAPIRIAWVDSENVHFTGLMRDLGVTPRTHVTWLLKSGKLGPFEGTLAPLKLDGDFALATNDFEVFDKAFDDPARKHMIGVREARLAGRLAVRQDSVTFRGSRADFGGSHVETTVMLGFDNDIALSIGAGSRVDLADISPLATLKLAGKATLAAQMTGKFGDPVLTGDLAVAGLSLQDFPLGDVTSSRVRFVPLAVEFSDLHGKKGRSTLEILKGKLDFNRSGALIADAAVESPELYVRDFLHMWHFDTDPRFDSLDGVGKVKAQVHYDLGGPADRCESGALTVRGAMHLSSVNLFDEHYDSADADFTYDWGDLEAGALGLDVDVRSLTLRKGRGALFGSATVRRGATLRAQLVASDLPLSRFDSLGAMGAVLDGSASGTAMLGGTLDRLEGEIDARVSPIRMGTRMLPSSQLHVRIEPSTEPRPPSTGRTRCGQPIAPPFDRGAWDRDPADGMFRVSGDLLGGQVRLSDLTVTRQRDKVVRGTIDLRELELTPLGELIPKAGGAAGSAYSGTVSGQLALESLSLAAPQRSALTFTLSGLSLSTPTVRASLAAAPATLVVRGDRMLVPAFTVGLTSGSGLRAAVTLKGEVRHLSGSRELDLGAEVAPIDLAALTGLVPRVEHSAGTLRASLAVTGDLSRPVYVGEAHVAHGELAIRGVDLPIADVNVDLAIAGGELHVTRGQALVGGGAVSLGGHIPIQGFGFGDGAVTVTAKGVSLPTLDGVTMRCDADLRVAFAEASAEDEEMALPRITGEVALTSFTYARPIGISADLGSLAQRPRRKFDAYDPADDFVTFNVRLIAREPLRLRNNLIDAQLALDSDALLFTGTNQRFGMRGRLHLVPGGRVRLRANEFEIRQGYVRFDDATRIAPNVDVTAVTDYRRYASGTNAASGTATVGRAGGNFRIALHAYGDADNLRLDMTSEPALSQEDIVLLLTIGMTRAELDQLAASNLGGSAALEALSSLTGADSAVRKVLPVIDDFHFGTAYSSKTGTTEPTVTLTKRLTGDVRANVTSGLSENREVRSNVEVRLTPRVSVQGSYDNVNDVSSSSLGNLGADVRYRLEFE